MKIFGKNYKALKGRGSEDLSIIKGRQSRI